MPIETLVLRQLDWFSEFPPSVEMSNAVETYKFLQQLQSA
jgi:hypothetical protein